MLAFLKWCLQILTFHKRSESNTCTSNQTQSTLFCIKVFIYLSVFLRNNKTKNFYSSPDLYRKCWSKTENDYCLAKVITSKPKKPLRDPQLSNGKAIIRLF